VEPFSQPWNTGDYFFAWMFQDGETDLYIPSVLQFEALKQANKGTGPVCNLQADSSFSNALKNMGICDAWQFYQDMTLCGHQYTEWLTSNATTDATAQLAATPNMTGFTSVEDALSAAAVIACKSAGADLGAYTVGTDGSSSAMTLATQNDFLAIGGFEIPYYAGLAVCQLYDAITGAYYPTNPERMVCTNDFLVSGNVSNAQSLASAAGLNIPATYRVIDATTYVNEIYNATTYPYDWTVVSRGKASELGKTWDLSGGVSLNGVKMGGVHSFYDVMGSDTLWSEYMLDATNRFADLDANVYSDLSKAPFPPTSATPGVHSWNWYLGQPPSTALTLS